MKALDTNVLVRILVRDDPEQAERARRLFEEAETTGGAFVVTVPVVLELLWVLSSSYGFSRAETLRALELLAQLPILELENHAAVLDLIRLGRATKVDLPDLLIGLQAKSCGCESTLSFEKRLARSPLFEAL